MDPSCAVRGEALALPCPSVRALSMPRSAELCLRWSNPSRPIPIRWTPIPGSSLDSIHPYVLPPPAAAAGGPGRASTKNRARGSQNAAASFVFFFLPWTTICACVRLCPRGQRLEWIVLLVLFLGIPCLSLGFHMRALLSSRVER